MGGLNADSLQPFLNNDLSALRENVEAMVVAVRAALPRSTKVFFEPGRWTSLGAGVACGTLMHATHNWWDMSTGGEDSLGPVHSYTLDLSGFLHGIWEFFRYPPTTNQTSQYASLFYGPSCYEGDRVGHDIVMARVREEGDIVAVGGLSGYAAALNNDFNGIPRAAVEFLDSKA